VSRLGNKAVTDVRQRVVRETQGRRGRASDPIWAARKRLLRAQERLSPQAYDRMIADLTGNDPTGHILIAWTAKEHLRALLATAKTGGFAWKGFSTWDQLAIRSLFRRSDIDDVSAPIVVPLGPTVALLG